MCPFEEKTRECQAECNDFINVNSSKIILPHTSYQGLALSYEISYSWVKPLEKVTEMNY